MSLINARILQDKLDLSIKDSGSVITTLAKITKIYKSIDRDHSRFYNVPTRHFDLEQATIDLTVAISTAGHTAAEQRGIINKKYIQALLQRLTNDI